MPAQKSFTRLDSGPISSPRARRASVRWLCSRKISTSIQRPREPLAHERVGEHARASRTSSRRRSIATSCSTCSFQTNVAPRSLASVVLATRHPSCSRADEVLDRDLDVVEEDLVELALPGDLAQRSDLHALGVHRDREHRDALVRRRVGVGPHERDAPVGEARVRRPHLLPGHDGTTSPCCSARVERLGEIAPGVGLAEQLAPDVVAGEDPRHPSQALLLGAVRHQRRPDQADAGAAEERRRLGARQLLVVDRDLRQRRAAAAVLDRPVDADPAAGVQRPLPLAQHVGFVGCRRPPRRRAAGARAATRAARRGTPRRPRRAPSSSWSRGRFSSGERRELEMEVLEATEHVDGRVLVVAGTGRAVLRLRDPDVGHAVEDALEG